MKSLKEIIPLVVVNLLFLMIPLLIINYDRDLDANNFYSRLDDIYELCLEHSSLLNSQNCHCKEAKDSARFAYQSSRSTSISATKTMLFVLSGFVTCFTFILLSLKRQIEELKKRINA